MSDPPPQSTSRYDDTEEAKRLRQTQESVDEVVSIMQTNLEAAMERDGKLSDMDEISKNLEQGCAQFKETSVKLRKKIWYQNLRTKLILGFILVIILALLIFSIFTDD